MTAVLFAFSKLIRSTIDLSEVTCQAEPWHATSAVAVTRTVTLTVTELVMDPADERLVNRPSP